MFKDWSDEKLLEEVSEGFRDYADIKMKDNQELVNYYKEQIKLKEQEINKIEWEMGVALKDVEEWEEVIERVDNLLAEPEDNNDDNEEDSTDEEGGVEGDSDGEEEPNEPNEPVDEDNEEESDIPVHEDGEETEPVDGN